ncbi:hypothetical protein BBJ28_00000272 [Nothophytophthora sp. Chile5]|nr:hypothetical protein BBJ28_00000272 [Nothophytophthora sp. Chile5]
MARGKWLSGEERHQILQMRQQGVPVAAISAKLGRSTHFIYRILRNPDANTKKMPVPSGGSDDHNAKKRKTTVSVVPSDVLNPTMTNRTSGVYGNACNATNSSAPSLQLRDAGNPLAEIPAATNSALLCAVESMEVSSCEPIPFIPPAVGPDHTESFRAMLNASVGFSTAPSTNTGNSLQRQTAEDYWFRSPAPAPVSRPSYQPSRQASVSRPSYVPLTQVSQPAATNNGAYRRNQAQAPPARPKAATASSVRPQSRKTAAVPPPLMPVATSSALVVAKPSQQQRKPLKEVANKENEPNAPLDGLFVRIQDEIRRLETANQSNIYDAQLLQVLVKFQAEMRLVHLQKTHSEAAAGGKRPTEENDTTSEGKETSHLLRDKLAMEIMLMNVQADRAKLELEREQIKNKMASILCRKRLEDKDIPLADVDRLFPQ